jgi:HK97 family phage major capsid protein
MGSDLKQLTAQVEAEMKSAYTELYSSLKTAIAKQDKQIDAVGETHDKTVEELKKLGDRYEQLTGDFTGRLDELKSRLDAYDVEAEKKNRQVDVAAVRYPIGDALAKSDQLKRYVDGDFHGKSGVIHVGSIASCRPGPMNHAYYTDMKEALTDREYKALTGTDNLREIFTVQDIMEIQRDPSRPMNERVRDVVPVVATTNESIQYAEEQLFTNNAATVAEGGDKPESAISYQLKRVPVQTIAHWIPIANQLLDDIPALRPYVQTRLLDGLLDEEDEQFLYGSGTEPDLLGFFQHPTVQSYDPAVDGETTDTRIDSIRRAMVKVRNSQFRPDAVLMSPFSLAEIELAKASDGHYLWTLPSSPTPTTLWRLPIVETTALQDDDFLIGSFRQAATIYNRMDATLRIAEQHADFFIKNLSVLLMEHRVALVIWRPSAFVAGSFVALTS